MNARINLHQKTRPYKIDVFGLQDNFIGCLQSYEDAFLGQVVEPQLEIKDDGTQTFTCKIPKFYLSEVPNTRVINPRWQDVENGILAENTRVLKVFIQFSDEQTKVFPFIIDKIINKRDKNFSVYKEISCNGLAFAELGKQGYKIELNAFTLEQDFAKDDTIIASADYWLDKIFPNEKDENGYVTKWLTPWCYEIRMDWRGYLEEFSNTFINGGMAGQTDGFSFYDGKTASYVDEETLKKWIQIDAGDSGPLYQPRDESIIYENPYVANWDIINNKLSPISVVSFKEKARYIDCTNSNKYNITQSIAEVFEVFCIYEYTCEPNGHFKKTYYDEIGNVWTGKKVIFFNRAIKSDNPYVINYQHNLNTISRTIDSSELYTKMYVNPIASETMDTGYVSIADTSLNPLLDDFILNFDYLYKVGSINDMQKAEIEAYKIKTHKLNKKIAAVEEEGSELATQLNEKEALKASAEASLKSAQEQLTIYESNMASLGTEPVLKDKDNPYSVNFVPEKNMNILKGNLRLEGINVTSIIGYADNSYTNEKKIFEGNELIYAQNMPSDSGENQNSWYVTKDESGFPQYIFTSINNSDLSKDNFGNNFKAETGAMIYLSFEYFPLNKYESICASIRAKIANYQSKIDQYTKDIGTDEGDEEAWSGLKGQVAFNEKTRLALYEEKDQLNFHLERILGPALREGYWQPENYEDPGEGHNVVLSKQKRNESVDNTTFIFDDILFEEEQKEYYYASSDDIDNDKKTYYPYIDLTKIYEYIGKTKKKNSEDCFLVSDFCLTLMCPEYSFITTSENHIKEKNYYYVLLDGKYYTFQVPEGTYEIGTELIIHTSSSPYSLTINGVKVDFELNNNFKPSNNSSYFNLTGAFLGTNSYLSAHDLYSGPGFTYSFLKFGENDIRIVALLTAENIDYTKYNTIKYSFDRGQTKNIELSDGSSLKIETWVKDENEYTLVYPRIFIDYRNVNTISDNFKVYVTSDAIKLTNFEDYQILLRKGKPYITLKITDRQLPYYILKEDYNFIYQISRANEQLYLDAKQVAKDSSKPKYSYEIQVANIPDEINYLELGQLCHINDYTVDVYKEYGYISELKYQLDKPSEDSVVISNYKTKFEDLFSSISAQNETMKQNQNIYNIAAASFTSKGEVQPAVLQTTLDNNNFIFNFTESNLTLDAKGGLVLTNTEPYENGVYGQLALYGSGLMCSGSVDENTKQRLWETAITPAGINAKLIRTGQLDTSLVRIMSGDQAAFQWNPEGLFAYKTKTVNGQIQYLGNSYVKFNESGLTYMLDGKEKLKLDWERLTISAADNQVLLDTDNGLSILDSQQRPIAILGRDNDKNYGLFFYSYTNGTQILTLEAHDEGYLHVVDKLYVGRGKANNNTDKDNYAGLCGNDIEKDPITKQSIRFWAGDSDPTKAEFTVGEGGAVKAREIYLQNSDGTKSLKLTYENLEKLLALI